MSDKRLTVIERAVVALGMGEREQTLLALAENSKTITAITNGDGYKQAHSARIALKNERVDISKRGKEARDDANAFSKAVISEERRLIGLIEPEEKRLEALQKAWDDAREAERREKAEANARRVAALDARVESISSAVLRAVGKSSAEIWVICAEIESIEIDDSFAERRAHAEAAQLATGERLHAMAAAAEAHEAEQARIKAEREELARLRAEQTKREAEERARIAEEERQAKAARDAEATRQAEQLRRQREEEAKAAAERQAIIDAENARSARIAAERRAQLDAEEAQARAAREAQEAAIEAQRAEQAKEAQRLADERAAFERERAAHEPKRAALSEAPPAAEIVAVLAAHYNVLPDTVIEWLLEADFIEVNVEEIAA